MPVPTQPTQPSPGRTPRAPRRRRAGRPARSRAPLSPLQAQVLAVGVVLLLTLLYLVNLRRGDDGMVRVEGSTIRVELREFKMTPQSVSIRRGNVVVIATNRGAQVHNLQIETIVDRTSDDRAKPLLAIKAMQPGASASGNASLGPGRYRWRSSIANDDDLGMYGVIEVRQ